jgi:hypothetical protein
VSCFGKLPFHREFLRVGLGSPGASFVVQWLERAHEAISKAQRPSGEGPSEVLSFAAPHSAGRGFVAGVVRQSSDGLRRHPVALFIESETSGHETQWPALPIALGTAWSGLRDLVNRSYDGLDALNSALAEGIPDLTLEPAETSWREAVSRPAEGGRWNRLTGLTADPARHAALNLLALGRAQREARSEDEGVSFVAPLTGDGTDRLVEAGAWLELFRATTTGDVPLPTIVVGESPPRLYALYRPVDGADLAAMLASGEKAAIEDVCEAWQKLPAEGAPLAAAIDEIVASETSTLADLAARLRSAGES